MTTISELLLAGRLLHESYADAQQGEPHFGLRSLHHMAVFVMAEVDRHAHRWRGEHAWRLEDISARLEDVCAELDLAADRLEEDPSIATSAPMEPIEWGDAA